MQNNYSPESGHNLSGNRNENNNKGFKTYHPPKPNQGFTTYPPPRNNAYLPGGMPGVKN